MSDYISPNQFREAGGTQDWPIVGDGMTAFFRTASFAQAARLVQAMAQLPGLEDHPPAVDLRPDGVTVRLITYTEDWFGPSQRDVELARLISAAARELGLASDPTGAQSLVIIPGAPDISAIMLFWRAVLGYEPRRDSPEEDLVDPRDRGPGFWFEQMQEPRPGAGGSIHVAVWVAPDEAEARIAAALAAGGRVVRDDFAPAWWTLADAAGNEADISTVASRD